MASEQVACRRCRTQKLRCDRQLPRCARCTRVGAVCTYPEPPDRKLIAARRKPPRSRLDKVAVIAKINEQQAPGACISACNQRNLIDVYFSSVFKASLIYHRPSFEKTYGEHALPQHTLLSVSALALNFLATETPHNREQRSQLQHLGEFNTLSEEYALAAGKEVLRNIDQPSLLSIQTCHNLGYFWFAHGDSHRNAMFSGIAYRASRSLLMDASLRPDQSWLQGEIVRRCFWVGWLQTCVNSDEYVIGNAADTLALETALPVSEESFLSSVEESSRTLAEVVERKTQDDSTSIWSQFLAFLFFWAKVRDHIASRRTSTPNETLTRLLNLQQELNDWLSTLPQPLTYSRKNLFQHVINKQDALFSSLHAMQHHCRLVLHSSLVPRFGGSSTNFPAEAIKMSTEASIRSAQGLADLANDFLAFEGDFQAMPPYVGYCMYVAGSIHVTMINSAAFGEAARRNLNLNLTVLQAMKPFWTILDRLWVRLVALCEAQVAKGIISMDSIMPTDDESAHSLDRPIAAYSLTRVKHEMPQIEELDDLATTSKLSPKMKSSATSSMPSVSTALSDRTELESMDMLSAQQTFDFDALAATYGEDWWQIDPSPIEEPRLEPGNLMGFV